MNIKISLGIFLPLLLIIFLVVLSTANIGFSVNANTIQSISLSEIFAGVENTNSPKSSISFQTITITNNFFLSKKYELPKLSICLVDKDGIKEATPLSVRYSKDSYNIGYNTPIDLPANSVSKVKVLVDPMYLYNYETEIKSYEEYDELLLIQEEGTTNYYGSYYSCRDIKSENLGTAIHIPIIK